MGPDVDFCKLIKELKKSGYTYTEIGAAIGRGESTVRNLARGVAKMPRYDVGYKIVEMHQKEYPYG